MDNHDIDALEFVARATNVEDLAKLIGGADVADDGSHHLAYGDALSTMAEFIAADPQRYADFLEYGDL